MTQKNVILNDNIMFIVFQLNPLNSSKLQCAFKNILGVI